MRFIEKIAPLAKVAVVISKADSLTQPEVRQAAQEHMPLVFDLGCVLRSQAASSLYTFHVLCLPLPSVRP